MTSTTEYYAVCDLCGDETARCDGDVEAYKHAKRYGFYEYTPRFGKDRRWICGVCAVIVAEAMGFKLK